MATSEIFFNIILPIVFIASCSYLVWFVMQIRHPSQEGKSERQEPRKSGDIVGKSKFDLRQSLPQATTWVPAVSSVKNANTFVEPKKQEHPRIVPQDEIDAVFDQTPPDDNLIVDLYAPTEYEGENADDLNSRLDQFKGDEYDEQEYDEDDYDEDEYEQIEILGKPLARGVSFESMGDAFRAVTLAPMLTEPQRYHIGETLLELKDTTMYNSVIVGHPHRELRVADLIDSHLMAFRHNSQKQLDGEHVYAPENSVPDDFDVRDYS